MENVHHLAPRDRDGDPAIDAERTVLASCMVYPRLIPACAATITGADFSRPAHETIWNAITTLAGRGEPTEPPAVIMHLEGTGDLRRVGGPVAIHQLTDYAQPNGDYYALKVRERADLRDELALGQRIAQAATSEGAQPGAAVSFIEDYLARRKERAAGRSGDPIDALLAEMLDTSALDNMPALEPLVGDLLHLDSLARIIGPSGHMKSFVTIDLAGHVGTGMNWHGHYVRQGTVVYLVAEGARGIRKRVRAWEQHYGLKMDNVLFLPRPVQAMGPEWDTFIEAMRRLEPALVVIDTQARVSVGVEENSNTEVGVVIERIEDVRRATGACVLVIHHTGHVGEHGRGASSAKGALQSELHVSKKGDRAANTIVTVKVGKQKDDEQQGEMQFGLHVVRLHGEAKPDGSPVTSVVLQSLDARSPADELAERLDKAGVPLHYGRDKLRSECQRLGISVRTEVLAEAARIRKSRTGQNGTDHLSPNLSPAQNHQPVPLPEPGTGETAGQTCTGQVGDSTGQAAPGPVPPVPTPRGGQGDGQPDPSGPHCTVCGRPLDPHWAANGNTTHTACG
ncbi:AAA family ATPase [Streptomyces desertarenae]|uniref:AAA family ATPase n=1 Tax=Streptomyces desertarenae TaxID=2666184 RepID=A0ABW4PR01_9ACTN